MSGALQIVGALLVLGPFAALQFGGLRSDSSLYLWPNLIGAALLAVLALLGEQWGFMLLEGCWAVVATRGLVSRRV
jgi:hypothetical protein